MVANYLITEDSVKIVNEGISSCNYYIKDEDLLLLKNDKDSRKTLLETLKVDSIIVSSLGDKSENTFNKDSVSLLKVGDKKWL